MASGNTRFKVENGLVVYGVGTNTEIFQDHNVYGNATVNNTLTTTGNVSLGNAQLRSSPNLVSIALSNVNIDSGILFVDSINSRIGINNTVPDAALKIVGAANISGAVLIGGNTSLIGNTIHLGFVNVTSTLQVTGNTSLIGNVTTAGFVNVGTVLNVTGNSTLVGNTIITGFVNLANTLAVVGNATFSNTLGVQANVAINATALLIGNATINVVVNSSVISIANATLNSTNFSGTANNTTNFNGIGISAFVNTSGNFTLTGNTTHLGFVNVTSTLQVTGNTLLIGNVTTTGIINVGTILNVTGNSTLIGNTTIIGTVTASNTVNIVGAITTNSTLAVNGSITTNGAAIINNTILINGAATINNTLNVLSNVSISNSSVTTFYVDRTNNRVGIGTATPNVSFVVNGSVNIANNLNVYGNLLFVNGDLVISGNLTYANVSITTSFVPSEDANATGASIGNSSLRFDAYLYDVEVWSSANPWSNSNANSTGGVNLGTSTQRWLLYANTGDFSQQVNVAGNVNINSVLSVTGITTHGANVNVTGNILANGVIVGPVGMVTNTTIISTNGVQTIIDSFPKSGPSTVKYLITSINTGLNIPMHSIEILLLNDRNSFVYVTDYGEIYTANTGTFDAAINGSNVELYYTCSYANTTNTSTVKVFRTSLT
jgi:hypothetical protein